MVKNIVATIVGHLACLFLSLLFGSTGWVELRVGKGHLNPNDLPGWVQSLYKGTIVRATSTDWMSVGAYLNTGMGIAIFGILVFAGVTRWYRYGFDETLAVDCLALPVWLGIFYWYWRLGR